MGLASGGDHFCALIGFSNSKQWDGWQTGEMLIKQVQDVHSVYYSPDGPFGLVDFAAVIPALHVLPYDCSGCNPGHLFVP